MSFINTKIINITSGSASKENPRFLTIHYLVEAIKSKK
jgi:hypothetical protein